MSSADVAVKLFLELEPEDFRVLTAIELGMSRHRYVPAEEIPKITSLAAKQVEYWLDRLDALGLTYRWVGSYVGYTLSRAGYDCLAMNALVKADVLEAFGKPLGVGKESDVYDALTPDGGRVALKFHRLGRTSFRQTRKLRGYIADRRHISWLYQSRLAAEKEFEALKLVHPHGVSVPEPIAQNRHVVVMGMIEGAELYRVPEIPEPEEVLDEILLNVRKTYLEAGVIHADLSEFNVILKPDGHTLIIDWPQYVKADHPNAEMLLKRDVGNILRFFRRTVKIKRDLEKTLDFIKKP
ncbi:MAG: serine/threonine-protein kinase RIO2 [Candidatus Bathyarchaeota archaeon]|nr:serine/threonine-protein kinase RIO2 [Candidatus Bathyarchaeota archaeon]